MKLLFLLLITSLNAFAWGPDGHMIVAEIAEGKLTPKAKAAVSKLLENHKMAEVSSWADQVKARPEWEHTKSWHYVDIPDGQDYQTAEHNHDGDAVTAITDMVQVLNTPNTDLESKQNALKFIIHFVGDLHQPLHAGRPSDAGGNKVSVVFMGRSMNLHSLWDSALILKQNMNYTAYARFLTAPKTFVTPYDLPEISFSEIISEDMAARTAIYNFKVSGNRPVVLDESYLKANTAVLNNRLLQGGNRLAALLNKIFQ